MSEASSFDVLAILMLAVGLPCLALALFAEFVAWLRPRFTLPRFGLAKMLLVATLAPPAIALAIWEWQRYERAVTIQRADEWGYLQIDMLVAAIVTAVLSLTFLFLWAVRRTEPATDNRP